MRLSVKEGVRYIGGRYKFCVNLMQGSFNEPQLIMAWDSIAFNLTREDFNFTSECKQDLLQFEEEYKFERKYVLRQDTFAFAKILFSQNSNKDTFKLEISPIGYLGQRGYNALDKIVKNLFGDFKRSKEYHPSHKPSFIQQESQPYYHKQANLFHTD